jgi:hypothetical protein
MEIATPYDLAIPNDSVVLLKTGGILGPTLVDIDTRHAQGVRIGNNGVLAGSELTDDETKEITRQAGKAMDCLANQVGEAIKKLPQPNKKSDPTKTNDPANK